jgi:hypothetical protein
MFFLFDQNNSGGVLVRDASTGIGPEVWIEAPSEAVALDRALAIGLYFDGEADCACCGPRWNPPRYRQLGRPRGPRGPGYRGGSGYVHTLDGTVTPLD